MARVYPSAGIVIPTHNRLGDLERVVAAVLAQDVSDGARPELVVVDDGSSDGTREWLRSQDQSGRLVALTQERAGPARARNRGAAAVTGEVLLFLGDDTVPRAGWLLAHLEEHRLFGGEGPLAVLGYTSFPASADTPFLRFINECGAQFGYRLIDRPSDVPFNFFYTSNISISRNLFLSLGGFREDFPAAAWEDIEFAYRAVANGMRIRYQPRARVEHFHRIRPRTFCRRQRTSGRSAAIFSRLHPELDGFLGVGRLPMRVPAPALCGFAVGLAIEVCEELPVPLPHAVNQWFVDICYLRGLAEGLQEHSGEVRHAGSTGFPPDSGDRHGGGRRSG